VIPTFCGALGIRFSVSLLTSQTIVFHKNANGKC
jgi:hypothetical protein